MSVSLNSDGIGMSWFADPFVPMIMQHPITAVFFCRSFLDGFRKSM